MKKLISLIMIMAMVFTISPALNRYSVITADAANMTFFYGFEDEVLPQDFKLTYCNSASYTNGILSFVPSSASGEADPMIYINKTFSADEVNQIKIRMYHNLVARTDSKGLEIQVYYAGTDASGNYLSGETNKLSESNSVKKQIELSSNGEYITYTLDFSAKSNWAGSTITQLRIDPVNAYSVDGDTVKIDYIMLSKKADENDAIISYEFETDDDYEGITTYRGDPASKTGYSVKNGCLNMTWQLDETGDTRLVLPTMEISTSKYEYAEIIMKHDISVSGITSDTLRMYMKGTFADGSTLKYSESYAIKPTISQTSNGEFIRYILPFTKTNNGTSLVGATITSIRIDPINTYGTYSLDSIRFVPYSVQYEEIAADQIKFSYTFLNDEAGCAKGTMKIDFGEQNPLFAKKVELIWANGNATDRYAELSDYTSITSKTGQEMANGYVISRPMYIPEEATAVIARVTDINKTFDIVCDIPADKTVVKTTPKFVAALASDFHFGDSSQAKTEPAQKYYDLKSHVESNADILLVAGDIVQWYGVKSMDEYYYLEYLASGKTEYTNYANYDPDTEVNQWDMAMNYFTDWNIPVYIVEGNHETPSAARSAKGHTGKYMKDWMTQWVNFAANSGMYDAPVEREKYVYDNTYEYATYYDDYVTADDGTKYHIITMRNLHMGRNKLSKQELQWLDKKLYESEATGTPVFLIMHVPLSGTVVHESSNDFKDSNFRTIVEKHPNTVIVSGHTHFSLYSDWHWTINGEGVAPSYINAGGVVDTALYDPVTNTNTSGDKTKCELVYAEVYEDRIVTRAYDVIKNKYIATSVNQITLKNETEIGNINVTKTVEGENVILTASCDNKNVEYQWYIGGEAAGAGASVSVAQSCTDFVAVRVTDASGSFRSESFDSIYDADIISDEGRTYHLSISDSDGYNYFTSVTQTKFNEWTNGVAGKTDNVYHLAYVSDSSTTNRIYAEAPRWVQKNEKSKYLVLRYNAMPLNSDTYVYLATSTSAPLSQRVKLTPNKWSNVVVVWDIENHISTTYVNGEFIKSNDSAKFWNNSDTTKNGIIRLCVATANDSTAVYELDAYIDDFEVYETVEQPIIMLGRDMVKAEINGSNLYSAEGKIAYVPTETTVGDMSSAFWCVVVDENGQTKETDAVVTDDDMLMYFDKVTKSYLYYSVNTYTDYSSIFINGVQSEVFTANNVKLYVNAKTAGDTVLIAQYDGEDRMVKVQLEACGEAGLNEITFEKDADVDYASVFVWDSVGKITPLTEKRNIFSK